MERWTEEKAKDWYAKQGKILGFNFLPKTAVNSTEMWQQSSFDEQEIDKELALAQTAGFNSCRVFLPYVVWKEEREAFLKRMDLFLSLAEKHGISMLPILFDDCAFGMQEPFYGKQEDPVPGVHNSRWTPSPGFSAADDPQQKSSLEAYVCEVVGAFRKDQRILAWDLYNEPGNSDREGKSLPLLADAFSWARSCQPIQPLTAGVWSYADYEKSIPELCDIISFHHYGKAEKTEEIILELEKHRRPIFCTEWLHRPNQSTFATHLPIFEKHRVAAYNWGLVLGRTQTNLSWEKRDANPPLWQHDLFYGDYTPYDPQELRQIQEYMQI